MEVLTSVEFRMISACLFGCVLTALMFIGVKLDRQQRPTEPEEQDAVSEEVEPVVISTTRRRQRRTDGAQSPAPLTTDPIS